MKDLVVIVIALVLGMSLLSVDRHTDDSGIEASVLLAAALGLTLVSPRAVIAVALALALPIAVLNGGAPALVFSGIGAAIGYGTRRLATTRPG